MGQIGSNSGRKRPQYRGGVYQVRATEHGLVAAAWPRKRGGPRNAREAFQRERIRASDKVIKSMLPREWLPTAEAIATVNGRNGGLTGASIIRPEDFTTARLLGGLFVLADQSGQSYMPLSAAVNVSWWLDWLQPQYGSIITRTPDGWRGTSACETGKRLQSLLPSFLPGACPDARLNMDSLGVESWPTMQQILKNSNGSST